MHFNQIVDHTTHPIDDMNYGASCQQTLKRDGVLVLPGFLTEQAISAVQQDGIKRQALAYYTQDSHNIYLTPPTADYPALHPLNRPVQSSKGCIANDQIPKDSALHTLYQAESFRRFLQSVLDEQALFEYADTLSSINLHYASAGQELGWHFDNSSFAITLMIQAPDQGGIFEYVKDVRNADAGEMNYESCTQILDGNVPVQHLTMDAGTLVLFRGRNSMHRVTPVAGERTRMLVVLAYNTEAGISLSESARRTFYGRLG